MERLRHFRAFLLTTIGGEAVFLITQATFKFLEVFLLRKYLRFLSVRRPLANLGIESEVFRRMPGTFGVFTEGF